MGSTGVEWGMVSQKEDYSIAYLQMSGGPAYRPKGSLSYTESQYINGG